MGFRRPRQQAVAFLPQARHLAAAATGFLGVFVIVSDLIMEISRL
jgi:hypothetical protein